jgi:hypothetical protein
MSLQLPKPISEYFEASNAHDSDALVACFDAGAIVHDEGKDMHGLEAIRAWNEETARKYQTRFDPTGIKKVDDRTVVRTQVAGNFDGSPIELDFRFKIANAKIEALEIG